MTGETHQALRKEIGAYATGQLSGPRWQTVHAHLAVCAACRADLAEVGPVVELLRTTRQQLPIDRLTDAEADPPPLSPALLEHVRATTTPPASGSRTGRSRRRWMPAAAAALVAVAAAATIGFTVGSSGSNPAVPIEPVAVAALDPVVEADAGVVAHTWGMEVKITATGFRAGEVYRVRVTDDQGRSVSAGEFLGTGDLPMRCNLNSSVLRERASQIAVLAADGQTVLAATV